jgi:hypothetical protein
VSRLRSAAFGHYHDFPDFFIIPSDAPRWGILADRTGAIGFPSEFSRIVFSELKFAGAGRSAAGLFLRQRVGEGLL